MMPDWNEAHTWLAAKKWRTVSSDMVPLIARLVREGRAEWLPDRTVVRFGGKYRLRCARVTVGPAKKKEAV